MDKRRLECSNTIPGIVDEKQFFICRPGKGYGYNPLYNLIFTCGWLYGEKAAEMNACSFRAFGIVVEWKQQIADTNLKGGPTRKLFDKNYKLLDEMYRDEYYPNFLVDKVKGELQKVIDLLETGETDTEVIQEKLDEVVCAINDLQEEFDENDSEIETVARDCIGETVGYVLEWFGIPIDVEEAIRERDW